jgi:chemotaxis protein CheD
MIRAALPTTSDEASLPRVFLPPAGLHCSAEPSLVKTVLGSCVSVCLCDGALRLSGINHFVLPQSSAEASLRYGDIAIDRLVVAMLSLGCRMKDIEAKIFGGAAVLATKNPEYNVGARNVEVARVQLRAFGIPIVAQRTGGKSGLVVNLNTESGEVLVRRVPWKSRASIGHPRA